MSRTVIFESFGGPEVLRITETLTLEPRSGEVRLRVRAIGLNRTELTLRSGRSPRRPSLPSQIGFEAAGEIEALGPDVVSVSVGDRVALVPTYGAAQYGLYADTSIAPARSLVKIPLNLSFEEAAATWVAYGTAWAGLIQEGSIIAGQSVVITAASSSVGLAAIQITKLVGAKPIAITRTSKKAQALKEFGAEVVIISEQQDVQAELSLLNSGRGADLTLDAVGGEGFQQLLKGSRDGGLVLLYGAIDKRPTIVPPFEVFGRGISVRGFALPTLAQDRQVFSELVRFVESGLATGALKPTIDRVFALEDIVNAHRYMESGAQFGKVIVTTS
jgi:NADPH:quinone reductase-like Zn-dependent oxidoreductase